MAMKVPVSWLREYVPFTISLEELASRLVITSCEVDRIVTRGVPDLDGNLGRYRVGKVLEAGKHPNADRLQLCLVDVGESEPRQIVCGAWNFGAGATVAVALPGAILPDGRELGEAKLRGETSSGMILAEDELELGADHSGIMLLPDGLEPGTPLGDVLPLTEQILEIETGFNRPDLTSIYGIAREVSAVTRTELVPPPGVDPARAGDEAVDVRIEDFEGCPRYVARLFRDLRPGESPAWMQARLLAAGMRPISNVVDITNYVMLALGSPLHAFDFTRLAGGRIVVRRARAAEEMTTLDGQVRKLEQADLVIADGERAVAIAGIMGGEDSEVRPETTDILLEAANFDPLTILRTSRRLRLRSEASTRWEKGVDPYAAEQAAIYATELLVELAGARWAGQADAQEKLPAPQAVHLRPERVDALIGVETPPSQQRETLEWLGFSVADDLSVTVPTWRARDVTRDVDLVEEVGRFRLDDVPPTLPVRSVMFGRLSREQRLRRLVEDVLVGAGWSEAYTWSLVPDRGADDVVRLPEPLSGEQAVLRTDLRLGLEESAHRNANAGNEGIALFEVARVYRPSGEQLPEERWRVGGITEGGFPRAKGAVEALYEAIRVEPTFERAPGRAARTGEGVVEELDDGWGYFELDLDELLDRAPELRVYEDVITFPAVKQDLAFIVDESVAAGDLIAAAREAAGPELREVQVFDVYRGEQVGEGRKSVALRLAFQSPERTLSDDDAAEIRGRIVSALAERFGAELRT
ncbi:MAG: phenylalanine--tRNA ligase subunit beta [Actinobacteria bacterium]|nr:phenylalanine--tRNA ligase subunit beta [Actinomycetota bacterium]